MNLMSSRTNKLLINYNPNNEIANRLRVERQRRLDSWGAAKHNILKQTKSLGIPRFDICRICRELTYY